MWWFISSITAAHRTKTQITHFNNATRRTLLLLLCLTLLHFTSSSTTNIGSVKMQPTTAATAAVTTNVTTAPSPSTATSSLLLRHRRTSSLTPPYGGSSPTTKSCYQSKRVKNSISSIIAGAGSGGIASVVCAPLDLVRTRMQVMGTSTSAEAAAAAGLTNDGIYSTVHAIFKKEGIAGCFRGLGATLATVPTFWAIYFPLYEECKREIHAYTTSSNSTAERIPFLEHMGSAIIAGAVADFFCNPMFVVRTRMQTEALHYMELPLGERRPHGMVRTTVNLYREGGVPIFWRGLTASLMGLSHVAVQFPVYEWLKAEARKVSPTNEESPFHLLLSSGISKMTASVLTYPHEVIRSRMMDARGASSAGNVFTMASRIIKEEGWRTMYKGLHVSLVRVVPNCCITFMTYELILRWARDNMKYGEEEL
uniref:Mitochondrial carrier protein n=1 Tax=Ditylum brightwellii TaxID=49249 RepID=A0A7S4W391_9STRA|mmetsp:Transcript_11294/g.15078  ORF Transcript_11294/g.15078 Transcript_11294/m.15078 type:complete len:424 (+) Transcript_11294:33-1304(+)